MTKKFYASFKKYRCFWELRNGKIYLDRMIDSIIKESMFKGGIIFKSLYSIKSKYEEGWYKYKFSIFSAN